MYKKYYVCNASQVRTRLTTHKKNTLLLLLWKITKDIIFDLFIDGATRVTLSVFIVYQKHI